MLQQSTLEFEIRLYDLFSEEISALRDAVNRLADAVDPVSLRGPLNAIVYELCGNALKALYKRAYSKYVVAKLGLDDLPYHDWLKLFRAEIEAHRAENFAHLCRQENIYIKASGKFAGDVFRIQIENDGAPSEIEMSRIHLALERAKETMSLAAYFDDEDAYQEGAGLGLPMVMVSLRGMGVDPANFQIFTQGDTTVARIDVPLNLFGNARSEPLRLLRQNKELLAITWNLFQQIDLSAARFDLDGHILAVSRSMLKRLAIPLETPDMFKTLVPQRFVAELFRGPQGIRVTQKFLNHRVYLENLSRTERILFNVSGYVTDKGVVSTLWQEIAISDSAAPKLNEGSLIGNLKFHNIIEPYIPQLVLMKARETVELGRTELPEEVRDQTIFFADLAGFTEMSESMRPHVVVEMLNMALSIMVRHIKEAGGSVDKFMGDAVMAVFADPLPACKAALEIQNTFAEVNRFRIEAKEPPVRARIGIHCGNVIMANIGTDERKDWTAIGDTVNTASRIEKNAPVGSILISDRVFERVKDDLRVTQSYRIKVKGKAKEISVYELEAMNSAPADS